MTLRRIGYWKGSLRDEYPLPQELETEYAPAVRDRLARYNREPRARGGPTRRRALPRVRSDAQGDPGSGERAGRPAPRVTTPFPGGAS